MTQVIVWLTKLETIPSDGQLTSKNMSGDNSIVVPPDPIPNSEVKRNRADGSVGSPHVRVGHRQTPNKQKSPS